MNEFPAPTSSDLNEGKTTGPLIFVDADNTLWDTDRVFADAQLQLLEAVEESTLIKAAATDRLAYIREVDQAIAQAHHLGLKYPPRLLVIALAHTLSGHSPDQAAAVAWSRGSAGITLSDDKVNLISERFLQTLTRVPRLRPGVRMGLTALKRLGAQIVVLTEGRKDRVVANLRAHDLLSEVGRVMEAMKTPALFKRLLRLAAGDQLVVMIGDQISRDIAPAAAVGVRTIYIPAAFKPRWESGSSGGLADYELCGFEDVPTTVAKLLERPAK